MSVSPCRCGRRKAGETLLCPVCEMVTPGIKPPPVDVILTEIAERFRAGGFICGP